MKYCASFLFLILLAIFHDAYAIRSFWRGKRNGGFLGPPSSQKLLKDEPKPKEFWIDQNLDHFNPSNVATWKQRYFVNDTFYQPGGPIFLLIGGESEVSPIWMKRGAWIHYAKELNALCFQLEHRYYGKSHPTEDLSTKNLVYLSSEQALADLEFFIQKMNEARNLPKNVRWIAFGGSYPGSLAAWLREKYPHLIHGAISTSGPLLAKVNFVEYYEIVKQSLGSYSEKCVESISKAIPQVELLMKHRIGEHSLDTSFKLCDQIEKSIDNQLDISNFFETLASNFAGVVQYNKDNRANDLITIDEVCDIMTNMTIGPPVARLAEVNSLILNYTNTTCLDFKYDNMITDLRNTSWESEVANGMRQWTYQTCTEFGFYQTSNNKKNVFGDRFPVDFFIQQCKDIFSDRFDSKYLDRVVTLTNTYYGALHPNTTNVLYVHGSIDPWHALGLTHSADRSKPTIYIEGTAHCANMYEPDATDPHNLVEARNKIRKFLRDLIQM